MVHNAACLKKNISRINKILLSHGHYDHTGGLMQVLKLTGAVDVHAHPAVFTEALRRSKKRR